MTVNSVNNHFELIRINDKCTGSESYLFVLEESTATYKYTGYSNGVELPTRLPVLCSVPPLFNGTTNKGEKAII